MLIYISDIPGELFIEEPHTPVRHLRNCSLQHNTVVKVKWQSHWVNFCSRTYEHLRQTLRPPPPLPPPFRHRPAPVRLIWFRWTLPRWIHVVVMAWGEGLHKLDETSSVGGGDGKEHPSDPQRVCSQVKITLHYGSRSQHPWCMFLWVAVVKVLSFFSL